MKTILISGGGSGLGRETAKLLQNEKLILLDINEKKLKQVTTKLGCDGYVCDVTCPDSLRETFAKISAKYKKIDVLINCAGVWNKGELSKQRDGHFADINSLEIIKKVVDTNTFGTIALMKMIVPIMQKQGGGQIININSQSGIVVEEFCPVYNASKHGSRAFSQATIADLARNGIRLTDVCPGLIKTDLYKNCNDPLPDEIMQTGLDAKEVAKIIVYLIGLPKNITIPSIEVKDIKNY